MKTEWKLIATAALGLGIALSTADAMDITGFGTTHSGGRNIAAENYSSSRPQAAAPDYLTTGSISGGEMRRPTDCPPPPRPGSLRTQGGNSGASQNMACPDYQ